MYLDLKLIVYRVIKKYLHKYFEEREVIFIL